MNIKKAVVLGITAFLFLTFSGSLFASPQVQTYDELLSAVREARRPAAQLTKQELVIQAWTIGRLIESHAAAHKMWSDYNGYLNPKLEKDLDMDSAELLSYRRFARAYPDAAPSRNLSLFHYIKALSLDDPAQRESMLDRSEKEKWSVLKLQEELNKFADQNQEKAEEGKYAVPAPGTLNVYRVVKAADGSYQGKLVLDLGFGNFYRPEGIEAFKEGDIITSALQLSSANPKNLKAYLADVTQVLDGDTFEAVIDLGFGLSSVQKFRFKGIDAPEMDTEKGAAAKAYLVNLMTEIKGQIILKVTSTDKYGRSVAEVWYGEDKQSLNQKLVDEGMAAAVRD